MSVEQYTAALARANEVYRARARVKRQIYAGARPVTDALELECCETMTVEALLMSQRGWGPTRTRRLLRALEDAGVVISPRRLLGDLTERQLSALATATCGSRSKWIPHLR